MSVIKYAAVVALLIAGAYTIIHYSISQQFESHATGMTYEAHYGSRAYATLPDGSKVWLNSGSKLMVLPGYNFAERIVELEGEAYFDVEKNPKKPFIVKVGEISIKATGTIFNVKAYPEEEQITTTLVEGVVLIESATESEKELKIQLKPNQTVSYKRQSVSVNETEIENNMETSFQSEKMEPLQTNLVSTTSKLKTETLISWMKDPWIIDNEEFGQLAVQLERRYNVQIKFESEELKQYRFTGTIERETVEQLFELFRYSIPLKYTIDKGIISLTPDKELKKQFEKAWRR